MGDVDVADKLRNNYWFDHWLRKRKWWWSIMFWAIGVILVNTYIFYRGVNLEVGVSKSYLLSPHNFRKQVAMAWISPNIYWSTEMDGPALSTWKKIKKFAMASSSSVDGYVSYVSKPKKLRMAKLDNNMLKPDGALFMRLDTTKCHLAYKEKGHSRCSLHRWLGFETHRGITYCETCNVNLCKKNFKYFHFTPDIASEKKALARKFYKEHADMLKNREIIQKKKYG